MTIYRKKSSLLAWTLFAVITLAALLSLVVVLTGRPADDNLFKVVNDLLWISFPVEFAFLSALIVTRRPSNVIGWLMILPATAFVIDFITDSYLEQFPTAPAVPSIPLLLAVWSNNAVWLLLLFPLLFTMLLFPDGRPLSPRWRWIVLAGLAMIAYLLFFDIFSPVLSLIENSDWMITNPIGLLPAETEFPLVAWGIALIALTLFCAAAPFVRYRRAAGVEQEQIKWLFYACWLFVLVYVPSFIVPESDLVLTDALGVLFGIGLMAIPAAIAIAITRYRLWDIDVLIRKTLVYAVLTGLLVLVYFGTVVTLQSVFEAVSGQRSAVSIVISTLILAALFSPLRQRVQTAIDRRFFRQKYDAQRVLAQFAQSARDEVELEALTAELERVLRETVQPQSVSIWLSKLK
jgi:hypothetical protein